MPISFGDTSIFLHMLVRWASEAQPKEVSLWRVSKWTGRWTRYFAVLLTYEQALNSPGYTKLRDSAATIHFVIRHEITQVFYFNIFTDGMQSINLNVLLLHVKCFQFIVHCVVLHLRS
jgi:hypothetical protein